MISARKGLSVCGKGNIAEEIILALKFNFWLQP